MITNIEVAEQYLRARVANTFAQITELLENHNYTDAKLRLNTLGNELDTSSAAARPFVIQLRAQVDEMLESVGLLQAPPPPPIHRMGWLPAMPTGLAPVLSRLASNTTTLGVQRGFMSQGHDDQNIFSSPRQRETSRAISNGYSQVHEEP
jgi:hypothetical protein